MGRALPNREWQEIPGFPKYFASPKGEIARNFILKQRERKRGYLEVKLSVNGKAKTVLVHQIIAKTFLGSGYGKHVNHKDGNKKNNRVTNLEWVSESENKKHAALFGLMQHSENKYNAKLKNYEVVKIREMAASGTTHRYLSLKFGVSQPLISRIVNRNIWKHV